jgi:hypothetical protein
MYPNLSKRFGTAATGTNTSSSPNKSNIVRNSLLINIKVNEVWARALFDTGSHLTYMRKSLGERAGLVMKPTTRAASCANSSKLYFLGVVRPTLILGKEKVVTDVLVSEDNLCPFPLLIGLDVLRTLENAHNIILNLKENFISIGPDSDDILPIISFIDNPIENYFAIANEFSVIPPQSDNIILCSFSSNSCPPNQNFMSSDLNAFDNLLVGKCLITSPKKIKNWIFPIRILNPTNETRKIYKNTKIAFLEEIANIEADTPQIKNEVNINKLDFSDTILSENAQIKLRDVIKEFSEAFVLEDGRIGKYLGPIKHQIPLIPGSAPPKSRPYRLPFSMREEIQKQLDDMLKQGIIEKSCSPFSAPIVMVKKRDGTFRMAIDYRSINKITVKQTFLLPLIQDILDMTAGQKIYSVMDLQSGFHQIEVAKAHRERTAFISFAGLFQFTRLPFGLISAPQTFQSVMNEIKKELSSKCFVYLDDIIIASSHEEEHVSALKELFGVLCKNGLKLKLSKCHFGRKYIKYLGFIISEEGIKPDPKNIESVANFKPPKSLKELQSLVGACSYFRKFIPSFSHIMKPLYELSKSESIHTWDHYHQNAFDTILQKLTSAPVL